MKNYKSMLWSKWTSLYLTAILLLVQSYSKAQTVLRWDTTMGLRFHVNVIDQNIPVLQSETFLKSYFNLGETESFEKGPVLHDQLGQSHQRFTHIIKNAEVKGSNVIIHYSNGRLNAINGVLYRPNTMLEASITKTSAIERAIQHINAKTYSWEVPAEEQMLKVWKEDTSATYTPRGEQVYCPQDLNFENKFDLCYAVEINAIEPLVKKVVYVSVRTGEIWAEEDLIHEIDAKGSANTKYRGRKTITADSLGPNSFRLRESGRGGGIETWDMNQGRSYSAAVDFTDTDNYWNNYNSNQDEVAGDAHFGAERTFDYFMEKFRRNSFDDNGAKIRSYIHYGSNYVNAFWNGSVMTYGDGNSTYSPLTTVDICGHEIAHAVTSSSAKLVYRYESGALNESFSDIFGNAIEYYADSTQFSWHMGEDISSSGTGFRNMKNPNARSDPDTYKGRYWYTGTGDNGGVHTNSGVQNFWFYLLCEGGSGRNDNNKNYVVDSIGMKKAEQIAYRNLTVYLTSSSQYSDARYYAIQSASDLFGDCSREIKATTNAWYAVGVGKEYDTTTISCDFAALDTHYCQANELVEFVNKSKNARTSLWDFGDGTTSTDHAPKHRFPAQGQYTIKLKVTGCLSSLQDSATIVNYISIDSTADICNGYLMPKNAWKRVHVCDGFVYDHNGEKDYEGYRNDTLTIDFAISDSAEITFMELDYEDGYDSLSVYDGYTTSGRVIGHYTGKQIPNNGKRILITQGAVTLVHFSDPLVVGTGFKAKFQSFRKPIALNRTPDTLVCYNQRIQLVLQGTGGSVPDHLYTWNGIVGGRTKWLNVTKDTTIYVAFGDVCLNQFIYDSIKIQVRNPVDYTQGHQASVCQGQSSEININPTGGLNSYWFTLSDGNIVGPSQNLKYNTAELTPGLHQYWAVVSDQCSEIPDTAYFDIRVSDSLNVSVSPDTLICLGTSVALSASGMGGNGNYRYEWLPGNEQTRSITVDPADQTTYTVVLRDGCSAYEPAASLDVNVLDPITIELVGPDTVCYGEEARIDAIVKGGINSAYIYSWSPDTSSTSILRTEVRGETTYYLSVNDGCTVEEGKDSFTVTTLAPLHYTNLKDTAICYGEGLLFELTSEGGKLEQHSTEWNIKLGHGFTKWLAPRRTTSYALELSDGCSDEHLDTFTVTVNPLPQVAIQVTNNPTCVGYPVTLSHSTFQHPDATYTWLLGDGNTSNKETVVHRYNQAGQYAAQLKIVNEKGCADSVKSETIDIKEEPIASFEFSPDKPDFQNRLVSFINRSKHATNYLWTFGDGYDSRGLGPSHGYRDTGTYYVRLEASNNIGCSSDTTVTIVIGDAYAVHIPNAFSPNGDELNDKFGPFVRGMKTYNFMVYNRHGVILFESNHADEKWDGSYKGVRQNLGIYVYELTGIDVEGNEVELYGTVHLVY